MLFPQVSFALDMVQTVIFLIIAVAGLVGAILAGTTREDAFSAGDRQSKWIWVGILAGSTLVVVLQFPFLSWAGMVAIGVYWFDVRPHLRSILSGNYSW
ncbi:DUF2516 family protein [Corynebacterium sp. A21]|uniref:DUF2516 family protein n=1 Tax=Corynebacterium sp. A21 TaxID=3457318 RepID=UPI003FCF858D